MRFEGVVFTYRGSDAAAIDALSLRLQPGVTGLLGVNGSGKTTLLRLALGELRPQRGVISRAGGVVGYCPQAAVFPPIFTVTEVFAYLAWLRRVPKATTRAEVARALEVSGLADHADVRVRALSGGMVRRIAIAQAFLGDPQVVLLDEPTTGLDPEQRVRCRELVAVASVRRTVLLSSHIIEDISAVADAVVILDQGRALGSFNRQEVVALGSGGLEAAFLSLLTGGRV